MMFTDLLIILFLSSAVLALILSVALKPILKRLDQIINFLEKK